MEERKNMKIRMWFPGLLMAAVLMAAPVSMANEKVLFEQDFESEEVLATITPKSVVLAEPGAGTSKRCISQTANATRNSIILNVSIEAQETLELTFDYRTEVREGELLLLGGAALQVP